MEITNAVLNDIKDDFDESFNIYYLDPNTVPQYEFNGKKYDILGLWGITDEKYKDDIPSVYCSLPPYDYESMFIGFDELPDETQKIITDIIFCNND